MSRLLLAILCLLPVTASARAQFGGPGGAAEKATISVAWRETPAAGASVTLGVIVDIESRWHIQAGEGSGDEQPPYLATTLKVAVPDGWTAGLPMWPEAHTFELGVGKYAESLRGYEGRVLIAVPVEIPPDAGDGPHAIEVELGYQACDDSVCIMPTETKLAATVRLDDAASSPDAATAALFAATLGGTDASGDGSLALSPVPDLASGERLRGTIAWYEEHLEAGATVSLGVILDVARGWHVQAGKDIPEDFIPTTVDLALPDGWTAGAIVWPEAVEFTIGSGDFAMHGKGYEGRSLALVPVTIPADAKLGDHAITATIGFQACDDEVCEMPTSTIARGTATVVAPGAMIASRPRDRAVLRLFEAALGIANADEPIGGTAASGAGSSFAARAGLIGLLFLGVIGGFLLNLTPCVLPVIPLKIMGLAQTAGNRGRTLALGIAMALGVVGFWMGLGIAIATVSSFTSANQLFQHPPFAIGVGLVIAVLAFGMCGLFSVQLPAFVYRISPSHDSYLGSFAFGIMAAVLSTPCTAPFMGAAAAAAVGQSLTIVLSVFASIGVGMALPYVVLAAFPKLIERMPRTGPASELVKQVMGLLMLAAAAYFVGLGISAMLVTPPEPPSRNYFWVAFAFVAAGAVWLIYRTMKITSAPGRRVVFVGLGILGIIGAGFGAVQLTDKGPIDWVYYTPERFDDALADGKAVVLEFTAEWCLNCKLLEGSVLYRDVVADRLAAGDVVPMKVDLTGGNDFGNAKLQESGSVTIPWIVVYPPKGEPTFAQNWYTPEMLLDGIDRALGARVAKR